MRESIFPRFKEKVWAEAFSALPFTKNFFDFSWKSYKENNQRKCFFPAFAPVVFCLIFTEGERHLLLNRSQKYQKS